MQTHLLIGTIAFVALLFSCNNAFRSQITEVHANARVQGDSLSRQLDELILLSNGIQIQGRALSPEEIEFTRHVAALQEAFHQWELQMKAIEEMKAGKKQLYREEALLKAIRDLKAEAETVMP